MLNSLSVKLLKDINPGVNGSTASKLTALGNGSFLFGATDGISGFELWMSDGTAANTTLVRDIFPGAGGSIPSQLTPIGNGKVLFVANNRTNGRELWVSDGTTANTTLLKDIESGTQGTFLSELTALEDGNALFVAEAFGFSGEQLWITDGTEANTKAIASIRSGNSRSEDPFAFTAISDGRALFRASLNFSFGQQLYITDGTTAGIARVKNINLDDGQLAYKFGELNNGSFLFSADDGTNGFEVWITDGTEENTKLVKNINPSNERFSNSSLPSGFTSLGNGAVVFSADDGTNGEELWISDGTTTNTRLVKDIEEGSTGSLPTGFGAIGNGKAIFRVQKDSGVELWVTDGTEQGTQQLEDIDIGDNFSLGINFKAIGNGKALFSAADRNNDVELWITDGTKAGTQQVENINSEGSSFPTDFTVIDDGKVVFSAIDNENGRELRLFEEPASRPDLVATSFDIVNDHMLTGAATLSFSMENKGNQSAGRFTANLVYSDNDIIGDGDDQIIQTFSYESLDAEGILSESLTVQIPLSTSNQDGLYDRALRDDITGMGSDFVSSSVDYLGVVIDPENTVAEANEFNNSNQSQGEDIDDFTYFPWDVDSNGIVTPTDAIFVINRLGQSSTESNALADFDGNGLITPTDAIAAINRLGYSINPNVFE